jgi:hypothetical protein
MVRKILQKELELIEKLRLVDERETPDVISVLIEDDKYVSETPNTREVVSTPSNQHVNDSQAWWPFDETEERTL